MNGLALLAAVTIFAQFDPQGLNSQGSGGWEEKDGHLQYVIHISPQDAQTMAIDEQESVAVVPEAIAGRFDTVVIRISEKPAIREPSAEIIKQRYPIRGPGGAILSNLNGSSGGGLANIDRVRDIDERDRDHDIVPTNNPAIANLGSGAQGPGGLVAPNPSTLITDPPGRDRDRDTESVLGSSGVFQSPADNSPPSLSTPPFSSGSPNDGRRASETPSTVVGDSRRGANVSAPGMSSIGDSTGAGVAPFGNPANSRVPNYDRPASTRFQDSPPNNSMAFPQTASNTNLFPNQGSNAFGPQLGNQGGLVGGNPNVLPQSNFPSTNFGATQSEPVRVAGNFNDLAASELPPAAKPTPRVIPSSEKGTKLSKSQMSDEDAELGTAGATSPTLPILFLLSVVTNIYSGIYLYKLRERYRSLLLNVRSGAVEA